MPTDSLVPAITAITGLVVGSLGAVVGLVKWLVPRMDAGYKAAIKLQEHQQETLAGHLARIAESTQKTAETQARLAEYLDKMSAKQDDHHRNTDVHRAQVDIALGLSPGGAPRHQT